MNPIQKAWLKILSPLQYVINEKLATRSGVLGKFGKFFLIGSREFGMHPTNRLFIFLNRKYLYAQAIMLHRYSVIKSLTHRGYNTMRPFRHLVFLGPICAFGGLFRFIFYGEHNRGYEPDRLTYLTKKMGYNMLMPANSLNQRTSAHYIECNYIYGAEMVKRYSKMHKKVIEERNKATQEEKMTRFADPTYTYQPFVPVHAEYPLQLKY